MPVDLRDHNPDDPIDIRPGAKAEIPPDRFTERDPTSEEPAVDDWIPEAETDSDVGLDRDQDQ